MENINEYNELIATNLDVEFEKLIGSKTLTWLPWVGKDYLEVERKLLIVAESHYGKTKNEIEEEIQNKFYTREVVNYCAVENPNDVPMFENLHITLCLGNNFDTKSLWSKIAFYNFVQRPMEYSSIKKDRPDKKDFSDGWKTFYKVIHILKPTDCLFVGISAINFVKNLENIKISSVKKINAGANAYARIFDVQRYDKDKLHVIAIPHSSQHFSPAIWHNFLLENSSSIMDFIKNLNIVNDSSSAIIKKLEAFFKKEMSLCEPFLKVSHDGSFCVVFSNFKIPNGRFGGEYSFSLDYYIEMDGTITYNFYCRSSFNKWLTDGEIFSEILAENKDVQSFFSSRGFITDGFCYIKTVKQSYEYEEHKKELMSLFDELKNIKQA